MFKGEDRQSLQSLINNGTITLGHQKMPQEATDAIGTTVALFRSLQLEAYNIYRVPSGLWRQVKEDTHSVGWETGTITPFLTILLRVHSICSLYSMGTFLQACWTGVMLGSILMM